VVNNRFADDDDDDDGMMMMVPMLWVGSGPVILAEAAGMPEGDRDER
jgi:hypothetical protein